MVQFRFYTQKQIEKSAISIYKSSTIDNLASHDFKHMMNILCLCFPYSQVLARIILTLNQLGNNDLPADESLACATAAPVSVHNSIGDAGRIVFVRHLQSILSKDIKSVVDVGCGNGDLLRELAVNADAFDAIVGLEHPRYTNSHWHNSLDVRYVDLSLPLPIADRFDLAICNEVAEHIDPKCLGIFALNLSKLSDLIILGASLVRQPGDGHIACRPPAYWKAIFEELGYVQYNLFRSMPRSLSNPCVWDCFLYAKKSFFGFSEDIAHLITRDEDLSSPSLISLTSVAHHLLSIQQILCAYHQRPDSHPPSAIIDLISANLFGPFAYNLELMDLAATPDSDMRQVFLPEDLLLLPKMYP